jgi:hypothetical protein
LLTITLMATDARLVDPSVQTTQTFPGGSRERVTGVVKGAWHGCDGLAQFCPPSSVWTTLGAPFVNPHPRKASAKGDYWRVVDPPPKPPTGSPFPGMALYLDYGTIQLVDTDTLNYVSERGAKLVLDRVQDPKAAGQACPRPAGY